MINKYVGEIVDGTDFNALVKGIKEDARKAHLPNDTIKVSFNDTDGLSVLCTGDVANLIRKRKDVQRFRCDVVGYTEKKKGEKGEKEEIAA